MHELLTLAQDAALRSAAIVRDYYGNARVHRKDDTSLVTEADTRVHDFLLDVLKVSGIPVLSEEDVTHIAPPYPEHMWIIDPLDGTNGFVRGTDDFAVMIGLIEHGRPLLSVVHRPVGDVAYYAERGKGAYRTTPHTHPTKLTVSERTPPALRVIHSVHHAAPYMHAIADMLQVRESIAIGSIGVKAGLIVEKKADYFLTLGALGEWDVCAPELITTEAGGTVTDRHGNPLIYGNAERRIRSGVVFSNGASHKHILEALNTHISTTTSQK